MPQISMTESLASIRTFLTLGPEELADQTRTDIRLHNPAVEARIPIELKIADKEGWSASQLRERLENQLVGQYLREAKYGIFLLVRRGNREKRDKTTWRLNGPDARRTFDFRALVTWLQDEALELCRANPSIDGLEVIGIDLTARRSSNRVPMVVQGALNSPPVEARITSVPAFETSV